MFLGIDLGTSALKLVLLDEREQCVASESVPLAISHPQPGWSEQDPRDWWQALELGLDRLTAREPAALSRLVAIGFSGQMHGATLLDEQGEVLRPAILWNDGRSSEQCKVLEATCDLVAITGNRAMAGFTAPKLLWLSHYEPECFSRIATVLLPKDYLRYRLSGVLASDLSDSAGTLWLDTAKRQWSADVLKACGLTISHMPALYEGCEVTGTLRSDLAARWGIPDDVVLVAGGGDNAASAVGLGVLDEGQAFVSLGTSGVMFVASERYRANAEHGVHSFCHALPGRWHQMAVTLSATASLEWLSRLTGTGAAELAHEAAGSDPGSTLFIPYLSGERTPWNNPALRGGFYGLANESGRPELARAVMEGVAFSLADGFAALAAAGSAPRSLLATGGGARSAFWLQLIADLTGVPVHVPTHAEVGAAFGAARLARLACQRNAIEEWCKMPSHPLTLTPRNNEPLHERYAHYQRLTSYLATEELS